MEGRRWWWEHSLAKEEIMTRTFLHLSTLTFTQLHKSMASHLPTEFLLK